jgi:hypothetical protein
MARIGIGDHMIEFLNPWGWLAALSLPALILIYLFRRQPRLKQVSSLFLWKWLKTPESPGPKLQKLQTNLLLLLQLLALLLLTLAVVQPALLHQTGGERIWVVLDLSASMQATDAQGRSAWEKAREKLLMEIKERGPRAQWAFIEAKAMRRVRSFMEEADANRYLGELEPAESEDALPASLRFALDGVSKDEQIWVVSDRTGSAQGQDPRITRWLAFGSEQPNICWAGIDRQQPGEGGRLSASLLLRGGGSQTVFISCRSDDGAGLDKSPQQSRELLLEPNRLATVTFELPPEAYSRTMVLRIDAPRDALSLDNTIRVPPVRDRSISIRLDLKEGPLKEALEKALRALPGVVMVSNNVSHIRIATALAEGSTSENASSPAVEAQAGTTLLFGPLRSQNEGAESMALIGPYLIERHHALMQGVELDGILLGGVSQEPIQGIHPPLVYAGDVPLFYQRKTVREQWVWNADVQRGTLLRSEAFPILIQNFIERERLKLPGFSRAYASTTDEIEFRSRKDWAGRLLRFEGSPVFKLREADFYKVPSPGGTGLVDLEGIPGEAMEIVMLNSPESNLTGLGGDEFSQEKDPNSQHTVTRRISGTIALIALGMMLGDWLWFRRRKEVG